MIKVLTVFGTRPEAIKMAPLCCALEQCPEIQAVCCVTGQHRDLLPPIMQYFNVRVDYDLDIMQKNQTLSSITARTILGLDEVLAKEKPDLMLVHGDPTTALSAALSGFYHKIPVGHVEAGLRTYDRYSPYPEEMNRHLIGQLAELHFAPTEENKAKLALENITNGIYVTGNTVIDAILQTSKDGGELPDELADIVSRYKRIVLLTAHRRENYGEPLENIGSAVAALAKSFPDVAFIDPIHPSPIVRETLNSKLAGLPNVFLVEPLDVLPMHRLMAKCYMVLTDSGGLQEEAPSLGKPVLVLRKETERPEAITAGTVALCGTDYDVIVKMATELLTDENKYNTMARAVNPYGDGKACQRIVEAILHHFGLRDDAPEPFAVKK